MKILSCIVFHLIFLLSNFQPIASSLRNETEEATNLLQRVNDLDNLFKENRIILETLQTSLQENKKIQEQILKENRRFKQALDQLSEFHNITLPADECAKCQEQLNNVCDESTTPPVCSCTNTTFPIGGIATNGCRDPCLGYNDTDAICVGFDAEDCFCSCLNGFPIGGEAFNGCTDPCQDFKGENATCTPIDFEKRNCTCKEGFKPIGGDKEDFKPIGDDACNGCEQACPNLELGYNYHSDYGCLKPYQNIEDWETSRNICRSEGGDLFTLGHIKPIFPKEINIPVSGTPYWIAVRMDGEGSPYRRVSSIDNSPISDDSPFWGYSSPKRNDRECVMYSSYNNILYDKNCSGYAYYICQIFVS